jgi:TPR repeat protein
MHQFGEGVPANKDKAFMYFQRAALSGHIRAQREMSLMLLSGYKGFNQIFNGCFQLMHMFVSGIRIILRDPRDERVLW